MSAFTSHTVRNERRSRLRVTSRQRPGQGLGRSLTPSNEASQAIGWSKVTRTTTRPGRTTAPLPGKVAITLGRFLLLMDPAMQPGLPDLFDRPGKRNVCGAYWALSLDCRQV